MAIEYGWTGFEQGDGDPFILGSFGRGGIVGAGLYRPRTGENFFNFNPGDNIVNLWASYARKNTALGVGTASATGIARVFFRIVRAPNLNNSAIFCIGTLSSGGQQGWIAVDSGLTWKVWSFNAHGLSSSAALSLNTWYRADLTHVVTQSGVNVATSTVASIYQEDGTLVETLTSSNTGTPIGTVNLPTDTACGNGSGASAAIEVHYDDLWWGQADGADQATLAFPAVAMRVSRVPPFAQGSVAQWTGDFRTQIDAPMQVGAGVDIQSNAVATQQTLFTKDSISNLGISGVEGALVAGQIRTLGAAGNDSFMLGGVAYPFATPTGVPPTLPRRTGVNYASIGDATFDGWEFGCRNDRGTSLQLSTNYLEVLHSGAGKPAPFTDISGPFKINIITYVGNGTYQTISTMGFAAQWLYICNGTGTALASGCVKTVRTGGTRMLALGASSQDTRNGVLSVTSTGFTLGPSNNVNQNGVTYVAIGMQDGGTGIGGYHLSVIGGRIGNNIDNTNVVFPEPFTPDIAWNLGGTGGSIIKTSAMSAGDFAVGFSGTPGGVNTNLIQALNADGYQVGNSGSVQAIGAYFTCIAMKISAQNSGFVHVGTATPGGSTFTVTGLPFSPIWVGVQRENNTGTGFWRCSLVHATAQSMGWNGGNLQNNGVTAITADGFSIGSALATAGVPIYWIALGPGEISVGCGPVIFPIGSDSGGGSGCLPGLPIGSDSGGGAGCQVSL